MDFDLPAWNDLNDIDSLLAELVKAAEQSPDDRFRVSVTLNTTGGIVTGMLVSAREWGKAIVEAIPEDWKPDEEPARTTVERIGTDPYADDEFDETAVDRIHLVEAHLISGSRVIPTGGQGFPWRGRMKDVSGWFIGLIFDADDKDDSDPGSE